MICIFELSLTSSDLRIPFKFQRRQLPLAVSFAMTINKGQGLPQSNFLSWSVVCYCIKIEDFDN